MTEDQIKNILGFTFNFHIQHMRFDEQSPDYIKEKWNKFIGIKPYSNFVEPRYYYLPQLLKNQSIAIWIKRWKVSEELFSEMKEIVYLLCVLNKKPLFDHVINSWSLSELIEEFKKIINIKEVNNECYLGNHELIKREIKSFLELPENKREYKLNLLL